MAKMTIKGIACLLVAFAVFADCLATEENSYSTTPTIKDFL